METGKWKWQNGNGSNGKMDWQHKMVMVEWKWKWIMKTFKNFYEDVRKSDGGYGVLIDVFKDGKE